MINSKIWICLSILLVIQCFCTPFVSSVCFADTPPPPKPASAPSLSFDEYDDLIPSDRILSSGPPEPSPASSPSIPKVEFSPERDTYSTEFSSPNSSEDNESTPSEIFNGTEYRFMRFVIRPSQLKVEGFILLLLVIYIFLSYSGRKFNQRLVKKWCLSHNELLSSEFEQVGIPDESDGHLDLFIANGCSLFYSHATGGKKSCRSLMIKFSLRPRQDLPYMIYEEIRSAIDLSWVGRSDRIELVFNLSPSSTSNHKNSDGNFQKPFESKDLFVWAIAEKRVMNVLREDRWDVRNFTEIKESSLLPSQMVVLSESGEITETILKSQEVGLVEMFKSEPLFLKIFDSLVLSGTTPIEPLLSELPLPLIPKSRTLTLRLRLESKSTDAKLQSLILKLCLRLIRFLQDQKFINLTNKLVKRRNEVSNLMLEESRKELETTREEERRKKLKAIQDEKIAKMSPNEQKKHDERERKRNIAKLNKKTIKRK
ncbi:hypothetical protein PPACK8108_LOCUS20158 [Phakopsora pachyrhizi]|uniref:Coiled-coil domain-containing protein 47 n=1 Tax=Phakopsora pachyrhizi TaxID=170000 RepID=A0AAV0BH09_PHAPC|nr:hypothetical protein PPACK8108_LOCUS20158 [Phakopsora pachyrhizi]